MGRDKARVHALRAALEMRAAMDTPEAIIARAEKFESYIAAEDTALAPTAAEKARQETAGARPRGK